MTTCLLFLAGLNPNMNVNSMDIPGGLSVKDSSQSQSRLPQWTHPNSMDNLSSAASPLDQNPSKHGMYLYSSHSKHMKCKFNIPSFADNSFLLTEGTVFSRHPLRLSRGWH